MGSQLISNAVRGLSLLFVIVVLTGPAWASVITADIRCGREVGSTSFRGLRTATRSSFRTR